MTETPLHLFNSLTRSIERFEPIDPAMVRLYSCGPTVYNHAHLGNLRAYVFTDTLRRTLNWKGYPTNHVINITDVGHLTSDADVGDDKLEAAARGSGRDIWEIARFYTDAFKSDLKALNILPPTLWSVATDHIQDMIAFAERIAPAHCYELDGGLYFDVGTVPNYGSLARTRDDRGEARIDPVAGKRHPQDFAIWRKSAPGENRQMEWESPWGRGAPGWHLECSVMSHKYLSAPFGGAPFDIHTGGIDHREIHHPNEIAQNQAYCGCAEAEPGFTGARFWMHNNFLVDRAGKMSKSSGEFLTLNSIVARGIHPLAYRLLCLGAHYRSELDFSLETLGAALTRLRRITSGWHAVRLRAEIDTTADSAAALDAADDARRSDGTSIAGYRSIIESRLPPSAFDLLARFDAAMSADLMTPQAIPLLEEALATKALSPATRLQVALSMDLVLGFGLLGLDRSVLSQRPASAQLVEDEVDKLVDQRQLHKDARNFAEADAIRSILLQSGVDLMDGNSPRWEWRPMIND